MLQLLKLVKVLHDSMSLSWLSLKNSWQHVELAQELVYMQQSPCLSCLGIIHTAGVFPVPLPLREGALTKTGQRSTYRQQPEDSNCRRPGVQDQVAKLQVFIYYIVQTSFSELV